MLRLGIVLLGALPAFAQLTTEQKVFDFQSLAALYAKRYAPYEWKQTLFGFDALRIAPWLDRVRETTNDLDFYELMVEYVANLNDGHDAYRLPSNFSASLGFTVDIYDGKVLVDSINRTTLPAARFAFVVGDELVSVDGVAVTELIDQFAKYARQGNDRGTRRVAASRIVTRPQTVMPHAVDLGDSASVVIRRANGALETYDVPWVKSGVALRQIDPVPTPQGATGDIAAQDADADDAALHGLQTSKSAMEGVLSVGSFAPIFTPPAGFVSRASDFFTSGTFVAGGFRIGFIRIPSYSPGDTVTARAQFQREITFFEQNTDGLVVDQMHNPGGDLCYGENLVALLMPAPFRPLGYEIRTTYEYLQLFGARLTAARASGNQTIIGQYTTIFDAIQNSYNGGQRRTDAIPLCGPTFDRLPATDANGNAIGYTKPLIMLMDEFSSSTADSVPAMIQDNQRGLLVGMRTNGLGGSNSLNISRFQVGAYSEGDTGITLSMMVRKAPVTVEGYPATQYIENVGVHPDVTIDYMTRDNLVNGGRPFVQAVTEIIVQQIQKAR